MTLILKKELEKLIGGYEDEAPESAAYPYKVFSAKRLSEDDGIQLFSLEVNVWDQHRYYSRADDILDGLEKDLHMISHLTDKMLIRFFKGPREHIPDPDKQIKRVREIFEMRVLEREV